MYTTNGLVTLTNGTQLSTLDSAEGVPKAIVFALPTPNLDSSGVAHLAEHLVFRYSPLFPEAHNLFAALSLLPVKINASSHNGFSYFYAVSEHEAVLTQVARYLYAGLLNSSYADADIMLEQHGVISKELALYERTPEYRKVAACWRGDHAPFCYHHWGGYSDTLIDLSPASLQAYKNSYYRPEHIHILTDSLNVDELVEQLESLIHELAKTRLGVESKSPLNSASKAALNSANYEPVQHNFEAAEHDSSHVYSWWLAASYHDAAMQAQADITQLIENLETPANELSVVQTNITVVIEEECNQDGFFAVRLVSAEPLQKAYLCATSNYLRSLPYNASNPEFSEPKYPSQINQLLAYYHREFQSQSGVQTSLSSPIAQPIVTVAKSIQQTTTPPMQSIKIPNTITLVSSLCNELASHCDLRNSSPIPLFITKKCVLHKDEYKTINEFGDWLIRFNATTDRVDKLTKLVQQQSFWLPRLNGDCYAMGINLCDDVISVYGVNHATHQNVRDYWCLLETQLGVSMTSSTTLPLPK